MGDSGGPTTREDGLAGEDGVAADRPGADGPTDGTPTGVGDALARAFAAQQRASTVGFDWDEPAGALEKVFEEAGEVAALVAARAGGAGGGAVAGAEGEAEAGTARGAAQLAAADRMAALHAELGDLLFAVVNLARLADVDPANALDRATRKFRVRFHEVERLARARGLPMPGTALELLDRIWDEVKERERQGR